DLPAGGGGRPGQVSADVDVLLAARRRARLRVDGGDAGAAGGGKHSAITQTTRVGPPLQAADESGLKGRTCTCRRLALTIAVMPNVDEMMRRYEDLSKRAADLRSYL